jgi:hypothetical protein
VPDAPFRGGASQRLRAADPEFVSSGSEARRGLRDRRPCRVVRASDPKRTRRRRFCRTRASTTSARHDPGGAPHLEEDLGGRFRSRTSRSFLPAADRHWPFKTVEKASFVRDKAKNHRDQPHAPVMSGGLAHLLSWHILGAREQVLCVGYLVPQGFVSCITLSSHFCQ